MNWTKLKSKKVKVFVKHSELYRRLKSHYSLWVSWFSLIHFKFIHRILITCMDRPIYSNESVEIFVLLERGEFAIEMVELSHNWFICWDSPIHMIQSIRQQVIMKISVFIWKQRKKRDKRKPRVKSIDANIFCKQIPKHTQARYEAQQHRYD